MLSQVFRSKRVFTGGEIRPADIKIQDGLIYDIAEYGRYSDAVDLCDLLIAPGIVDLHSDAIEKEIEPRPNAFFPVENAVKELDKKLSIAGVTTMFHAVSFESSPMRSIRDAAYAENLVRAIFSLNKSELRVDNRIHSRFEISSIDAVETVEEIVKEGLVSLLSVMDHSPGQGQFKSDETMKVFYKGAYGFSDDDVQKLIEHKKRRDERGVERLIMTAVEHGVTVASHDDDRKEKIDMLKSIGISISEFPLCLEVAKYAKECGMATGMGAPNIVRGGSQSGNISAGLLVENGVCDYLCSDYHPVSMIQSVFKMVSGHGLSVANA
jgi:alpha-D-ribose 1-methylphosphonate 5-triphosphate diphosphatase